MKTYKPCNTRYDHNHSSIGPADRRAREVRSSYGSKFRKLDRLFAADVVGDGSGDVVGPFESAQGRFWRGGVIPLCAGGFGEINKDFEKLAREASSSNTGMMVSPLVNTDRKGGAFAIMHQQFKRAIGVAIVRGNAKHRLGRLHYVRATAEEARDVCRANHSDNRWNPNKTGYSGWYSQHAPEGYGCFEQFRRGYDYNIP